MRDRNRKLLRRRRQLIKDKRGLPARRIPLHRMPRRIDWMLYYCIRRSGVVVVIDQGRVFAVMNGWPDSAEPARQKPGEHMALPDQVDANGN